MVCDILESDGTTKHSVMQLQLEDSSDSLQPPFATIVCEILEEDGITRHSILRWDLEDPDAAEAPDGNQLRERVRTSSSPQQFKEELKASFDVLVSTPTAEAEGSDENGYDDAGSERSDSM
eukprot:gene30656-38370_t